MGQRLFVWIISCTAIAFVVGFIIGGVALKPDTESNKTTIAELEAQLFDLNKSTQTKLQNAKTDNSTLQRRYDGLLSELKKTKANYLALQKEHSTISSQLKNAKNVDIANYQKKLKNDISLTHSSDVAQKVLENNMNLAGYKTYCNIIKNKYGTYDIVMTSGSYKDNASPKAIDDYIGAAVASVGELTAYTKWKSKKLIIKIGFGKKYEILTSDCRKCVELFNRQQYQEASDYLFSHLRNLLPSHSKQ